jgi:membrane protein DedA with SNARE-associated domain
VGVRRHVATQVGAQFALYTTAGSLIWNAALITAGYQLGAQWHRVEGYVGEASVAVYAVLGVAVLWFVMRRLVRRSRQPAADR